MILKPLGFKRSRNSICPPSLPPWLLSYSLGVIPLLHVIVGPYTHFSSPLPCLRLLLLHEFFYLTTPFVSVSTAYLLNISCVPTTDPGTGDIGANRTAKNLSSWS